jgi:hypothetical protein
MVPVFLLHGQLSQGNDENIIEFSTSVKSEQWRSLGLTFSIILSFFKMKEGPICSPVKLVFYKTDQGRGRK